MSFHPVLDIQSTYRKMLQAMARPGTPFSIEEEVGKLSLPFPGGKSLLLSALLLLDTEVSFAVVSEEANAAQSRLHALTYARVVPASEADYIFVMRDAPGPAVERALREAKVGTLTDPQRSATFLIEARPGAGQAVWTGPGIRDRRRVPVLADESWMDIREQRNREFPLGIDMFLLTPDHLVYGLPRTTRTIPRKEAL